MQSALKGVGGEDSNFRLPAFLVLYNITSGIPSKYCRIIMILIQEIKRNMVYRRYQRETASADGVVVFSPEPVYLIPFEKFTILGNVGGNQPHS
jgi:hypothetical protein